MIPSPSPHGPVLSPLTIGHDALLGEVRGLYAAERRFLHTLGLMAQVVRLRRVRQGVVALVTATGGRLWRLEEVFARLGEDVADGRCPGLHQIVESRWMANRHRLQHALLELHVVGTTLQEAATHLAIVYAVAARRAQALGLGEVEALLTESATDATAMTRLIVRHTGVHPTPDVGGRHLSRA